MLKIKQGVVFKEINDFYLTIFVVLRNMAKRLNKEMVITSANDGVHRQGSKHYQNLAVDIRTKHLSNELKQTLLNLLRHELGSDYDVILEDLGGVNEHIHIEYDPKTK